MSQTLGQFVESAIFDAKKAGKQFPRGVFALEVDKLHAAWLVQDQFKLEEDWPKNKFPPPHEAVTQYAQSIGYPLDGRSFCDSYGQKGWLVGKAKMKDWQAAVRNWKSNTWGVLITASRAADNNNQARDYTQV